MRARGRRGAAPRLLPQPDRDRLLERAVGRDRRAAGHEPVLPIVDLAYQGLGLGMEEDAYGARKVIAAVPEALVAY